MRVPSVLRQLLQALAALVHGLARALEAAAGGGRPAGQAAALEALAQRFPGAPEHWLRVIAERAPHLVAAVEREAAVQLPPIQPPTRLRLAWPSRRAAAPDLPDAAPEPQGRTSRAQPSWPAHDASHGDDRADFTAAPPPSRQPTPPGAARPEKTARPQLRLVASGPDRRSRFNGPSQPAHRPTRGPVAVQPPTRGSAPAAEFSTRRDAAPPRTLSSTPPSQSHRPEPSWTDRDVPPPAASWTRLPAHTVREPSAWSAAAPRADAPGPSFAAATSPTPAPDLWEPVSGRPHDRAEFGGPDFSAITERTTFAAEEDARWPALPAAHQDETAEGPSTTVGRHIREQEFGGWSA